MSVSRQVDDNPRPSKRQKSESEKLRFDPLPPTVLLLSLQSLLAHPPTHRNHTRSLFLSLFALRKCLSLSGLDSITECRVWTELAEVGLRIGLDEPGIESEVEKAITKALLIIQKHPSLRIYKPQLTRLSSKLALHQSNTKFAQNTLKKLMSSFLIASDPPHLTYTSHLSYISSLSSRCETHDPASSYFKALTAIRDLHEVAKKRKHIEMEFVASVLELCELVQNGLWIKVSEALANTEKGLSIMEDPRQTTDIQKVLIVHALVIGILFYTYVGDSANAQTRMKKLHDMLDGGALDAFGTSGIVKVTFSDSETPLEVQFTHPRVIFALGFLASSVSKRDPVGRKPKRKLFAHEGTLAVERELRKEVDLPIWASLSDVVEFQQRMHRMKTDMLCEIIGVAICRSEFDDAERELAKVIAYTRTHGLFSCYSARITLHKAHLTHALGESEKALQCYQISAFLSRKRSWTGSKVAGNDEDDGCEDYWVNVSARAGGLWLRVGLVSQIVDDTQRESEMDILRKEGTDIAKECEGLGGTLQAIGAVLTACLSKEFLVAKTHLRVALNLSTASQDNHLRALVLSLVAAQYVHTSTEHAESMLGTAEQLAAGLGAHPKAPPKSSDSKPQKTAGAAGDGVGNAHLRLWIGERCLELKRRAGDEAGSIKQVQVNEKLEQAVDRVQKRKFAHVD